jgi:predicted DsbA family dithiol-disulfide isomerase
MEVGEMKVEIYSDVVCPWCYVGEKRFERALAAYPGAADVEVVFRPYQLDPAAPAEAYPLRRYLERRFGGPSEGMTKQVSAAATGEGITFDWDRALAANTFTAHRLARLAEREYGPGVQRALVDRLFAAHFTDGQDVGDLAVLTRLAVEAGMDEERVRSYLTSDEGAEELASELDQARRLGIRAVPSFVFEGKFMVQGAQSASVFLQALEEVEKQAATVPEGSAGCDDGACAV